MLISSGSLEFRWFIYPYSSGLLHSHCASEVFLYNMGTIAPVPMKQHWMIWMNGRFKDSWLYNHSKSYDDVIKWKHFPRYWPFVRGIHRSSVNSPHKGQWPGALMFSLICALNKRLSKQWWDRWFETPSCPLWRHCYVNLAPLVHILRDILHVESVYISIHIVLCQWYWEDFPYLVVLLHSVYSNCLLLD